MPLFRTTAITLACLALDSAQSLRKRRTSSKGGITAQKIAAASKFISGVPVLDEELAKAGHQDWMVFFKPGVTDAGLVAFCEGSGAEECHAGHPDEGGVPFVSMRTSETSLQSALKDGTGAAFVVPDIDIETIEEPDEVGALASPTWGVDRIGARRSSSTGAGVNVYVLDSGVRCSHQEFGGRCVPTLEQRSWGGAKECNGDMSCARDGRGHGTHCAGSVGAATYGVAPGATIRAINRGSGWSKAYNSMDWIIQKGVYPAVLSMSFGSQSILSGSDVAVDKVVDAGITVVVAAGNWNMDVCGFSFAYIPSSITVASMADGDERSSFSNFGSCNVIFAPGSDVTSLNYKSDTGTSVKSGTSMATPHVAGAAALLLERDPSMSPQKVRGQLLMDAEAGAVQNVKTGDPNLLLRCA